MSAIKERLTYAMLWAIEKLNPGKDRVLAQRLLDMAMDYHTDPDFESYYKLREVG